MLSGSTRVGYLSMVPNRCPCMTRVRHPQLLTAQTSPSPSLGPDSPSFQPSSNSEPHHNSKSSPTRRPSVEGHWGLNKGWEEVTRGHCWPPSSHPGRLGVSGHSEGSSHHQLTPQHWDCLPRWLLGYDSAKPLPSPSPSQSMPEPRSQLGK